MREIFPWFAARMLFEASVADEAVDESGLFEERIVLIQSKAGIAEAEKKARKLGKAASESYQNADDEDVRWTFKDVLDIVQLNELTFAEGSESLPSLS